MHCTALSTGSLSLSLSLSLSPRGHHQRSAARLGLVVDVRVPVDEEPHNICVALPAGEGEGRVVVAARGHVEVCTRVEEELCGLEVALSAKGGRRGERLEGGREGGEVTMEDVKRNQLPAPCSSTIPPLPGH